MSFVIRPLTQGDFEALFRLVKSIKSVLSSLPPNEELLRKKLAHVQQSFHESINAPTDENYLFVLEEFDSKKIAGTCGLYATTTGSSPFIYLDQSYQRLEKPEINFYRALQMIQIKKSSKNNPSELCSLYLNPNYRSHRLGHLLSYSRYHFIYKFPERFTKTLVASMLGFRSKNGKSPFWRQVIKPFFGNTLDITYTKDKELIYELLPKEPLYTHMFPPEAQLCIGKVHYNTRPALQLLMNQNFTISHMLDPLDAGPYVSCEQKDIKTIQEIRVGKIVKILPASDSSRLCQHLIGNLSLDFRCCQGDVTVCTDGTVAIPENIARMLNVESGMDISYSPLN